MNKMLELVTVIVTVTVFILYHILFYYYSMCRIICEIVAHWCKQLAKTRPVCDRFVRKQKMCLVRHLINNKLIPFALIVSPGLNLLFIYFFIVPQNMTRLVVLNQLQDINYKTKYCI